MGRITTCRQNVQIPKATNAPVSCEKNSPLPNENYGHIYMGNKLNGVSFRRQHAIGNYIVDFCAIKQKLIIELDDSQHIDQAEYDRERTAYLESEGYQVIRFWNNDVMNDIQSILRVIDITLRGD